MRHGVSERRSRPTMLHFNPLHPTLVKQRLQLICVFLANRPRRSPHPEILQAVGTHTAGPRLLPPATNRQVPFVLPDAPNVEQAEAIHAGDRAIPASVKS